MLFSQHKVCMSCARHGFKQFHAEQIWSQQLKSQLVSKSGALVLQGCPKRYQCQPRVVRVTPRLQYGACSINMQRHTCRDSLQVIGSVGIQPLSCEWQMGFTSQGPAACIHRFNSFVRHLTAQLSSRLHAHSYLSVALVLCFLLLSLLLQHAAQKGQG